MSDTQDLLLKQRQIQQRQILAMMGIGQWVQADSPTQAIDDILKPVEPETIAQQTQPAISETETSAPVTFELSSRNDQASVNIEDNSPRIDNSSAVIEDANIVDSADTQTEKLLNIEQAVEPLIEQVTTPVVTDHLAVSHDKISPDKVAPFDLQGGRYGNWVLIVDIQALNNDSQKLWQNITQALSLTCETTSFPICEGMDTAELANASLAGYLFKIGRSEDIKVAALTKLPDGLSHPNFIDVPSLDDMLADSTLKRDLWQQISQ